MNALTAILVATLLGQGYYSPEEAQSLFQQANADFYKQDYKAAREGYEKLLSHGFGGPDVQYNLGTLYLAQGDVGPAVLAFERSRREGGEGPDLEATWRSRVPSSSTRWWARPSRSPSCSAWCPPRAAVGWRGPSSARGGEGSSCCCSSACCVRVGAPGRRCWGACCCVWRFPRADCWRPMPGCMRRCTRLLCSRPPLRAREFPREEAKVSFEVHPGQLVRVMEETGHYVRIRLPNGLEGWTEREGIAEI